jgi:hypothetical protein
MQWEQRKKMHKQAVMNDARAKQAMKEYGDHKLRTRESTLKLNDLVIVRQEAIRKSTPVYEQEPYRIIDINGSMITASNTRRTITRNSSAFKIFKTNDVASFKQVPVIETDEVICGQEESIMTDKEDQEVKEIDLSNSNREDAMNQDSAGHVDKQKQLSKRVRRQTKFYGDPVVGGGRNARAQQMK